MTETITHRAFFGDGDHAFTLTNDMIVELEQISGAPIGALYLQFPLFAVPVIILREIIRLGLIGAPTNPTPPRRQTPSGRRMPRPGLILISTAPGCMG